MGQELTTTQELVAAQTEFKVAIVAETGTNTIRTAAEGALEETKTLHTNVQPQLTYHEELLARSYTLGTVRAAHRITFHGDLESAADFFQNMKERLDTALRHSPQYRIIEETPEGWWEPQKLSAYSRPSVTDKRLIESFTCNSDQREQPELPSVQRQPSSGSSRDSQVVSQILPTSQVAAKTAEGQTISGGNRLGGWLWLGITALFLTIYLLAKLVSRQHQLPPQIKSTIARQHVTRYAKGPLTEIGQRRLPHGTEYQFQDEAEKNKFTVIIDESGRVRSWRRND